MNKNKLVSTHKLDQYIDKLKLNLQDKDLSKFVKFEALKNELGYEYESIDILESICHFANRKGITQQGTYIDFMIYHKDKRHATRANELLELFSSLINVKADQVRIIRHSIYDARDLVKEIFVLSEDPKIDSIAKMINDQYGHIFKLEKASKDTHPKDSTLLGNFLYGKVERWKYHDLLDQGANDIKIVVTDLVTT